MEISRINVSRIQSRIENTIYTPVQKRRISRTLGFESVTFPDSYESSFQLSIDGDWTAEDFISNFQAIKSIYDYFFTRELITEILKTDKTYPKDIVILEANFLNPNYIITYNSFLKNNPSLKSYILKEHTKYYSIIESKFPLKISKLTYASPGFKDLAGFGEAVEHIKDIFFKLFDYFTSKGKRKEELRSLKIGNNKEEIETQILEIKRNKEYIQLLIDCGYNKTQIREIFRPELQGVKEIYKRIRNKKVKSIKK